MTLRSMDDGASSHCRKPPKATHASTPTVASSVRCRRTNSRRKTRSDPIGTCRVRMRRRVRPTMISPCSMFEPCIRRDQLAIDTRSVSRAEVAHVDAAVLEQRQQRVLRRRMLVVHDDVTAEVTPDAAFGARAREALPQDRLALQADLFDQHHGLHCKAPR